MSLSVLSAAEESPDRAALIVGDRTIPFRELASRVRTAIAWLAERGVTPENEKPVALVGRSDIPSLEILYALIEIGAKVALLHPRLTEGERRELIDLVDPVLVVDGAPRDAFVPHRHPSPPLPSVIDGEACLAILFTSGTTGEPKGVILSRRAFAASARASEENLGFQDDDRWLLGLPVAHVGGLSVLTRCLIARRAVVVPEAIATGQQLSVDALTHAIGTSRATLVSLVPTQLERLLEREPAWVPPPHLRAVLLGGAAARPTLLERAKSRNVPVLTTYGLTEACSQVTTERYGTPSPSDGSVGATMSGTEVRIIDDGICVRGPTLFSGYLTRNATTLSVDADGFFHTDDLGRLDAEGRLHVIGRRSDTIVTGGENVYPAQVEAALERCPGVAAACVFGVPDETWGQIVAVALVSSGSGLVAADLAQFVSANLAPHRRPRKIAIVDAFVTTPAGKLDRPATARATAPHLRTLAGV